MKITFPQLNINNISPIKRSAQIPFRGAKPLESDVFIKVSSKNEAKKTTVKDLKGNDIPVTITKSPLPPYTIMCSQKGEPVTFQMDIGTISGSAYHAHAYGTKETGSFHLEHLYTDETYNRRYKGAGTELLKCVVEESKKRGLKGKVNVGASNFPPPFVFYYKNNFHVISNQSANNAGIDYATRKGIPVTRVLEKHASCLPMELNEEEAKAFLEGKRLYLERSFKTIDKREIKGKEYEANLIEAPKGLEEEYYLQIIDNTSEELKQKYVVCLKGETDDKGEKYLQAFNAHDVYAYGALIDYAEEALNIAAKELGYDKAQPAICRWRNIKK